MIGYQVQRSSERKRRCHHYQGLAGSQKTKGKRRGKRGKDKK